MSEPVALENSELFDTRRAEVSIKLAILRALMRASGVESLHLTTTPNMNWLTAGAATSVNESEERASFSALVTEHDAVILTDPIEEPRLRDEERLDALGFTLLVEPWRNLGKLPDALVRGASPVTDAGVDDASQRFQQALVIRRATLLDSEQARLREGARRAVNVIEGVARALRPGMTELEICARLAAESRRAGGSAIVALTGSDERIARYRHPLPTRKAVERYVMLVLCLRYRGLVSALTRSAVFGTLPARLLETATAVARVDARMIEGTVAGRTLGDIYTIATQAYASEGQPEAIEQHHQGGPIAYRGREAFASPGARWRIEPGQAFAWNPSLRGAKSEDTILLTERGAEILTRSADWPVWEVETDTDLLARPAILTLPG